MSYGQDYPLEYGYSAEHAMAAERAGFIRRTYAHLAGAILAFIAIEFGLLSIPGIEKTVFGFLSVRFSWLLVLRASCSTSASASTSWPRRSSCCRC